MKSQLCSLFALVGALGLAPSCGDSGSGSKLPPMPDRSASTPEKPKAWIEAERTEEDFGAMYADTVAGTSFPMVAAGEEDLVIAQLTHECGCTEANLFVFEGEERAPAEMGKAYPPGTRFELDARLNTKGKNGEQHQDLGILMGKQGENMMRFTLKAVVEPFLVADPPVLNFEKVSALRGVRQEVRLRARAGDRFGLEIWREILCDGVEAELSPVDPGDDGRASEWNLAVNVLPGRSGESFLCRLLLATDIANELAQKETDEEIPVHRFEFQVAAQIEPVMRAWPERLNFGTLPSGASASERFIIRNEDEGFDLSGIRVAVADAEDPTRAFRWRDQCDLTAKPMENGRDWEVHLEIDGIPEAGAFSGVVLVDLGHPYQEGMTVAFGGAVGGP